MITKSLTLVGEGVTDVSSLSILRSVRGDINISSTSLTSLQGLENIIDPNPPEFSNYPELNVRNNLLLENLDALSNYTGGVRKLIITNNPQLNSISNLQINDFMRELTLKDIPATNFSNFSTLEICDKIIIDNISPNILAGLNSLSIVNNSLEIKDIDIQNLNALSNINTLYTLKLTNIPNFNNLNGIGDDSFYFTYKITETPPTLNLNFLNDLNFNYTIEVVDSTLSNLSILSNLTTVFVLSISGNDNLQNLTGLENITNLTYLELVLNPQLVNLNGLNSLESVSSINIRFNTALVNFSGLESLISFGSLRLINNNSITSLDGPTNLNLNNQPSGLSFLIDYNPLLADYCSISNYISLNGIQYGEMGGLENYRITNNLYNPSLSQIQTPEGCSQ